MRKSLADGIVRLHEYDWKAVSDGTGIDTGPSDLVQQQFGVEADINTIMRRFHVTGEMPSGIAGGVYGDFSGVSDYADAVEAVDRARRGFMTLPPEVREKFGNDPGKLIAFAQSVDEDEFTRVFEAPKVPPVLPPAGADGGDKTTA